MAFTDTNPEAPSADVDGPIGPPAFTPTEAGDLPELPDWVPPIDGGITSATDINDLSQYRRQTVASENTPIPICYGRDSIFGSIMVWHIDDSSGDMYLGFGYCKGEINGYETTYIDDLDRLSTGGAYVGLKNRGFESGTNDGWSSPEAQGGTINSTVARTGTYGINIPSSSGGPNHFSDRLPAPPEGTVVRIKAWAQRNSSPDADVGVTVRDATTIGGALSVSTGVGPRITGDKDVSGWQEMEVIWTVPTGVVEYVVDLGESEGTTGSWDIDDVSSEILAADNSSLTTNSIEIISYRGEASQPVDSLLVNVLTEFEDTYNNLAYQVLRIPKGSTSGFPRVRSVIQGRKLYDPRKDTSIEGGSGSHDENDPSTWEYSTNPSLAFYDLVKINGSWQVNVQSVMSCADFNDEVVGGGVRQTLGLTLYKPSTIEKWAKVFRVYCGAYFAWEDGSLRLIPNRADVEAPGAIYFGEDEHITVPDSSEYEPLHRDWSIEFHYKSAVTSPPIKRPLITKIDGSGDGFDIYLDDDDDIQLRFYEGPVSTGAGARDAYDGQWHHFAVTYRSATNEAKVYLDTVYEGTLLLDSFTSITAPGADMIFGSTPTDTKSLSSLDEIRIWNSIRTEEEIAEYAFTEISDPSTVGLLGYWRLNETVGPTVSDYSSLANDGTLSSSPAPDFVEGVLTLVPDNVVAHFTENDIIESGFRLRKKASRNFPTQVQVEYTDSSGKDWPVARQIASAPGVLGGTVSKRISKISLPGVHDASQALRTAIERLNWFLSDLECTLPVFDEGLEVQQGSIVAVTHPIGLTAKLFRVRQISGVSGRYLLDLVEYDPKIYSNEVIANPTFPDTQLGDPLNPPQVADLSAVEELYITKEGNTGSRVRVTWTESNYSFLSQYRVEGLVNGARVWQTFVGINEAVSPGVEQLVSDSPVSYDIKVYIRSGFAEGKSADASLTIQGKLAPPGNVTGLTSTRLSADSVKLKWQKAIDIDIWRYEVRQGTTSDSWETATLLELVDGLNFVVEGLNANTTYRLFVKAIDSVRNESVTAAYVDVNLSLPSPVTTLNGFEIGGEVRLSWEAPEDDPYVARYRVAYDAYPTPTTEKTLDVTDSLVFSTRDVPAGDYTFKVFSQDEAGNETDTAATRVITVTLDTDAFLADSYDFVNPTLTNMVEWSLRTDSRQLYVTNQGAVFIDTPSSFVAGTPLATYHPVTDSEWLSETKDFGLVLTGNWILTQDVEALSGTVSIDLELSVDGFGTDSASFSGGVAKGAYRYARVRISTFNPPGSATAFVKSPQMNLRVNVVPLEESGESTSNGTEGLPKTITLDREYTAVKEVNVQPKNKTDALMAIVDNIIVGPNTGIKFDGVSWLLSAGDVPELDFGTGDFTYELWAKNDSSGALGTLFSKRWGDTGTGYELLQGASNNLIFSADDGSVDLDISTPTDSFPEDGAWHHIAVLVDRTADTCKIRVDHVEEVSGDISTLTGSMDNIYQFAIGARTGGANLFEGSIDEVRVWDDIRTTSELSDNANAVVPVQASLVAYWRFDGSVSASVTTTLDETTNDNDLTITGGGDLVYTDPGSNGNVIQKPNSFDVYVFDIFGQQLPEDFQWNWKAV